MADNGDFPVRGRARSFLQRMHAQANNGQPAGVNDPRTPPTARPAPQFPEPDTLVNPATTRNVRQTVGEELPVPVPVRKVDVEEGVALPSSLPAWDTRSEISVTSSLMTRPPLDDEQKWETGSNVSVSSSRISRTTGPPQGFEETRKHGKKGNYINVMTNFVRMEDRKGHQIRQYRVDFDPIEDNTFVKKTLMYPHEKDLGRFIFDGAMLYTNKTIPEKSLVLESTLKDRNKFKITLRYVGSISNDDPTFIQFYNTVFRKCLAIMKLAELGRHFFDPMKVINIENAPLKLWPGYITAIKKHDAGVLLCIEATHKVLRTTTVLDMIREILGKNPNLDYSRAELKKQLVGQIVITHYNKKTYRIDDIDFDSTPEALFTSTDPQGVTKETTYIEYYNRRYGICIEEGSLEVNQPMLVSQPRKKDLNKGMRSNFYLIPSLCNLTGLSDAQRRDFRLMQKMSDHLHMNPVKRKAKLQEFMDSMKANPAVANEFHDWDVVFNPQFLQAKARALDMEEIHLQTKRNADCFVAPDGLADFTNLLKRNYMLDRKDLVDWVLYLHADHKAKSAKLLQGMRDQANALGMRMFDPLQVAVYTGHFNMKKLNDRELLQPLKDLGSRAKFVVFVLPNNQLERYKQVKKFFVLENGVPMQCLLEKNIESKNFSSIMSKLMIQVNAKLGGVPWSVKIPFKTRVMILGFDVYHCAERKNESVGALVGTISPNLGTYFSVVSFHKDKSELSSNMCLDTKKCLEAFRVANGDLPDRIILYRDGVGEGQIKFVVDHEVKRMQEGIIELYQKAGVEQPKFTFIVVTKKINNRFMTVSQTGSVCNPLPGTVLDEIMTIPGRYDFFLVSQSVRQGTVSPTSYNVIFDNSGVSADAIQQLSYKLCHLYYNWSGTVAVPAPCQFAHKLAYLTGVALCQAAPPALHTKLWYL